MKIVVILAVLIAASYEQTHPPVSGPTHEPSESASIYFHYDYVSQKMSLRYQHSCYIFTLSDQQKLDVHTDAGIKALELKLLPLIDSGHKTEVQKSDLSAELQKACGRISTHFYTMS